MIETSQPGLLSEPRDAARIFDMRGRIVIVTGGARGLGRSLVQGFAEAGASVAIVSRKLENCIAAAREIERLGVEAFPFGFHVGDWNDCRRMVDAVLARFGRIDVLVNNAGMSPVYDGLDSVGEDYFDKVLAVNLKGPYRLCTLVGSHMYRNGGGRIINISSIASEGPAPFALPYSAAKAALNAITVGFATAYHGKVNVNAILAGSFATEATRHWQDPPNPANPGWTKDGRRVGMPSEIVGTAIYLASDASSFTSGALLRVDGGPVRTMERP